MGGRSSDSRILAASHGAIATLARPADIVPAPSHPKTRAAVATRDDMEFLPSALEIVVTPPSPVAMWMMTVICAGILSALVWSYFGWLDIHAIANGKIQPNGRTKVVQPLEPGRVIAIHVENGARVEAGQVLLELDPTETTADREALARDLESSLAEAARRTSAIASARSSALTPVPIVFANGISEVLRRRETAVLTADIGQLRSQIASLRAQYDEKNAMKIRLQASIDAREKLLALARERVAMRQEIETRGAGSRAQIIEALQQFEQQMTTQATERGQLLEMDTAMASIERKLDEARTQFIADQTQKLAEIERKSDRLEQELIKAKSKRDRTELRAPLAGTVQQLNVSTVGQVVTSGQSLMTVVPIDGTLEVEAMIANKDIGFVKLGQEAVVKIEAFPFTRYGAIAAHVVKISRDAVDDRENAAMTDAATAAKPQNGVGAPSTRTQNLVFPATLRLDKRTISIDGEEIPLTPGMAVTVEIKTGQRRAIDYVLSPLREIVTTTAHER